MNRPLRIALVRKEVRPVRGGAENYTAALASGLARMGHEVHLFVNQFESTNNDSIRYHKVPMLKHPNVLKNYDFARNVEAALKWQSGYFDIITGLSKIWYQDIYRISDPLYIHWVKMHPMAPIDVAFGFLNPRLRFQLSIEKKLFKARNFRRIVAISQLDQFLVKKYYHVPDEKIRVIYNGVDHDRFNLSLRSGPRHMTRMKYGITGGRVLILFAAMDWKRKGLVFALEALSRLGSFEKERVVLMVVGRGDRAKYEKTAGQLGVSHMVKWIGPVDNIEAYYGAADIFLFPTLYDPFANVHLEALASGLPVITTRMAGGAEIVRQGDTGYVVKKAQDTEAITSAILKLMDSTRRRSLNERCSDSVREFTVERNTSEMLDLYNEVIEERMLCRRQAYYRRS